MTHEHKNERKRGFFSAYQQFRKDNNGVAAIEFVMVFPMMITLFLGSIELSEAFSLNRKVAHVASVVGDLSSQTERLEDEDVAGFFETSEALMYPYNEITTAASIALVYADDNGNRQFIRQWDSPDGGVNIDIDAIPESMLGTNAYIYVSSAEYTHTPRYGHVITGDFVLSATDYYRPRDGGNSCPLAEPDDCVV